MLRTDHNRSIPDNRHFSANFLKIYISNDLPHPFSSFFQIFHGFVRSTRRWRSDILQLPDWKLPSPALKKSMDFTIFALAIWAICTWIAVSRIIPYKQI
jgi:hypothetical protein